jgi:hypothetical protein
MILDFALLLKGLFMLMCLCIFFLGVNIKLIGWKDRDRHYNIKRALLPHEKKLVKGYQKQIIWTIAIFLLLVITALILHANGILLPEPKK